MSMSGISSASSLGQSLQTWQAKAQKIQSEFQQLGQDLQAGNLSQAKSDFTALSQNTSGSIQNNSSLTQAFSTLGSALQSGNLSAAQKAYSTLQQDVEQTGAAGGHYHHRSAANAQTPASSLGSTLSQLLASLGSSIQSGGSSTAQTAYSTLAQDLQQLTQGASGAAQIASQAFSFMG